MAVQRSRRGMRAELIKSTGTWKLGNSGEPLHLCNRQDVSAKLPAVATAIIAMRRVSPSVTLSTRPLTRGFNRKEARHNKDVKVLRVIQSLLYSLLHAEKGWQHEVRLLHQPGKNPSYSVFLSRCMCMFCLLTSGISHCVEWL